jgi:hypothetical protein
MLYIKILTCAALTFVLPAMLSAQESSASGNPKMDKLIAKRETAQARVNKADAERISADSLIAAGISLTKECDAELDEVLDEQAKLEDRVFKVELPVAEKQMKSKDHEEQAQGLRKRNEIRKAYNVEIKTLQSRFAAIQKKKKDAKQSETRGQEKKKLADKAWKEAIAALKTVEKEMEAFEDSEKAKERAAQQMQKRKEEEQAAKQKQREEAELKKQKDKEAQQAKKEAEKAKSLQEKEKLKSKEAAKREKEKEAQRKQKEKEAANREAEKAKKEKQRAKEASSK